MRILIDTNCFLAILPVKSIFRSVYDAYRSKKFELIVSTEILNEYSEIFSIKMTPLISENIIELILEQTNTIKSEIYFKWSLLENDYDDNKFVDAAIASGADYIVTADKHFNILNSIPFPKLKVISLPDFMDLLQS